MSWHDEESDDERRIFGVPAVLTQGEIVVLLRDLEIVWSASYGRKPGVLDSDFSQCRRYFDPVARGHTLRERLAELVPLPESIVGRLRQYGEPLTIVVGDRTLLAGVEARLMIDLLRGLIDADHGVMSQEQVARAENLALRIYRDWGLSRLRQVIDLRAGVGTEVMQGVAVGLILALLVNRSDTPERAVVRWDSTTQDGRDVDQALYDAAEVFATAISHRSSRTQGDKRLKGGYGLTEARRRLAHRLEVMPDISNDGSRIFVPRKYRDEVITFVARDLSRRSTLTLMQLEDGFDQLVHTLRDSAKTLAYRSMTFELASETDQLRSGLLSEFIRIRNQSASQREDLT
jgi:hypothetical protein